MKQIAIQKQATKRKLTIEQIAPTWSRILPLIPKTEQQEFYKDGMKLDISEAKWCIVGEAHGFDRSYFENGKGHCRTCFAYSVEFGGILLNSPSKREESIQSFVSHWNSKHT